LRTAGSNAESALAAEALLTALARELDKTHPSAASLREGMDETLTVLRLDVPPTLAPTLRSTNAIESMISICGVEPPDPASEIAVRAEDRRSAGIVAISADPGNSDRSRS
jgi:hypothetical protein